VQTASVPIFLLVGCAAGLAIGLLALGLVFNPGRAGRVKRMPYESGMDPIHDARRRFDVRFHLLAIAFLVFDVELLFLYPWAVALRQGRGGAPAASREAAEGAPKEVAIGRTSPQGEATATAGGATARPIFVGGMVFVGLLALGFVYDWRKGVFRWR